MTGNINNKRIARNTIMLYIRMLVMIAISLYTSRIVLKILGIEDFGLYQVVGGIVVILSFLNNSMASATQRFLNVELGKKDITGLKNVFNTSLIIHIMVACAVLLLAETVGLWFLNTYISIPHERLFAANCVYQFSVLSFLFTIVSVPYNATIIAHEEMSAFAYISVVEALLKLFSVLILYIIESDKLIVYSCFTAIVSVAVRFIYSIYCKRKFVECRNFRFKYDKALIKRMLGFSSWTIIGALGSISHTQGIAVVLNMFFGVAVNAALGITNQVTNLVNSFVTNFMTAINPQIVKTYASDELAAMHVLVKRGCRMGIFLVSFFSIPLILETPILLNLWLGKYPPYTVIFIRIVLVTAICNAYAQPLATAKGATGRIKNYQIILTTIGWLHLPIAWILFEFGLKPYWAMYVYFILINIMQMIRIYMVANSIDMSIKDFVNEVILRSVLTIIIASVLPVVLHISLSESIWRTIAVFIISFLSVMISIYVFGLNKAERYSVHELVRNKFIRKV